VFTIAKAAWAIELITVTADIAVFIGSYDVFASEAFTSSSLNILNYHGLRILVTAASVFINAGLFAAQG